MMVTINMIEEKLDHLANTFRCAKGALPFTYLGFLFGLIRPRVEEFLPW
jgi:hypothetical protein